MSSAGVAITAIREDDVLSPIRMGTRPILPSEEPILIYLTVAGSVLPMPVLESDSVASVKLRIQTCKGFVVKKQKLVFGGRELARSDCCVRDYGVSDGNILHLVLRVSDLQAITVKTTCGKEFEFHVERFRNVAYVKQQIAKKGECFENLKDQDLLCNGEKLDDQQCIDDISKDGDAIIHLLVMKSAKVRAKPVEKDFELSIVASEEKVVENRESNKVRKRLKELQLVQSKPPDRIFYLEPIKGNPLVKFPSIIKSMIASTSAGLEKGHFPVRSSEGSGGAYFMQDFSGNGFIAVFKPIDEEPMAVNNPHGLPLTQNGEGLKRGTRVEEGALREVAAYILDHPLTGHRSSTSNEIGFSGVCPTVLVKCLHEGFNHPEGYQASIRNLKVGSLQMYVKNCGSCEDMGPRDFPVEEVHKITVLDIRLANADRHAGNILVCKEGSEDQITLVPIDHGYCLPETFEDCTFDWLYWPQAKQPYSKKTLQYIQSLDARKDIQLLKHYGWELSLECSRILCISTMLLKKGAERGLSPFIIGSLMCRETLKKESVVEQIIHEGQEAMLPGMCEDAFLEYVSQLIDCHLEQFTA